MKTAWRARNEWKFASVLPRADRTLAAAWWTLLILRGLLPALFALAMGALVGAVERHDPLAARLAIIGLVFVLLQVLTPIHQAVGTNLGSRTSAWLYDRLTAACVTPPGMGHLENPKLTNDITMARDFDLGISGPPMSISMDFIAGGLVEAVGGIASAIVLAAYTWWAPLLLVGAWLATHWLLREGAVWKDRNTDEVREAQRHADYTYRLAVEPPAAKELRLFGLADWIIERFSQRRRRLFELRWESTRLRERPVIWSLLLVLAANVVVFWSLGAAGADGALTLGRLVTFASAAVYRGRSMAPRRRPQRCFGCRRRWTRREHWSGAMRRPLEYRRARFIFATSRLLTRRRASRCSRVSTSRFPPARRLRSSARMAPARLRSRNFFAGFTIRSRARSR
jgi:ABC-type multidrug transport system fused ATPase/permease subunit